MSSKVLFLARNDGTDMRQTKVCNSLCRLGFNVTYVGWNRQPGQQKPDAMDPAIEKRIFDWPAGFGEVAFNGWPQFFRFAMRAIAEIKPDVVHARDEPMAAMVLPLRGIAYRHLVLEIFDSLAARSFPSPSLRSAAWAIRTVAHAGCDRIIETGEQLRTMLGRYSQKAIVIQNVPSDPGEEIARDYPTAPGIQVCVGGSLSRRGDRLDTLLRVAELLPPGEIQIQASGWFHDEYSRQVFANHRAVNYRWLETPDEFRRQAAKCDALTYLRGDASDTEYRSWVSPNRVFDAMSVARPVVVSRELKIAAWIEQEKLGYAVDPDDYQGLAGVLSRLRDSRRQLPGFVDRVRPFFLSQYTWQVMEARLGRLYSSLVA
jgi:glycosyltransferase involved in cell wall biosynthesis